MRLIFFDEINTNENLAGLIKHIIMDRNLEGDNLPDNLLVLGAINPYKYKSNYKKEDQKELS